MINKIKEIATGWSNVIIKDEEIEALAKERDDICSQCPIRITQLGIYVCGDCGCPLIAKQRSPESQCPRGKWQR